MQLWGLHAIDLALVAAYIVVVLWLGKRASTRTTSLDEFFLAGRTLGKVYQFFLNFGCSTHADQAVAVSREVYRQGIGGMWIQSLVLFLTPFYWFTTLLFRRVRLTTIGDYFAERFDSRFLAACYAVFTLVLSALIGGGIGYLVAAKTMVAMTPKPIELCSPAERQQIQEFAELRRLEAEPQQDLPPAAHARVSELREKEKRGELRSFVSYVDEKWFYLVYVLVVGIYTMLGGFRAAALTDAIQGILIVIFSVMLAPVGLARLGGLAGLHARVPSHMFELFGSATLSDYGWYTVVAMVLANLVSIVAVASGMQTAGSATNEFTARIGMIGGMFLKRILMLFWAFAGLLAIGLYGGRLHDPDLIWGVMTRDLLWPGAIGLMLVGVLSASMSWLGASALSHSALFIRNLYRPWFPDKGDAHYLVVGRLMVAVTLAGGIVVALMADNLLGLFQYIISVPAIFGASIWLGFLWRRATKWAVILQVFVCLTVYALIPTAFSGMTWATTRPAFLAETAPRTVVVSARATSDDVVQGRASAVGQRFERRHEIAPVGIYFDRVARTNPSDPLSPKTGLGRFNAEIWLLGCLGVEFTGWSKAQLLATRFFFDALFPFVLLFAFSYVTRPVAAANLDRFFARVHTPVQSTPDAERAAIEAAYANPRRYDGDKLFPGTGWEILRPSAGDFLGFFGTCGLVGVVVLLLWLMVTIQ
jgi:solute:Na+ symporter, SSS family